MTAAPAVPWGATEAPTAYWADQPAWTVLDCAASPGRNFLHHWRAWQSDLRRPGLLHYVLFSTVSGLQADLAAATTPPEASLAQVLHDLGLPAEDGFHRLELEQGRLLLTVCLGEPEALARAQPCLADSLLAPAPQDKWAAQRLARHCRRGTRLWLHTSHDASAALAHLRQAGMQLSATSDSTLQAVYDPAWQLRHSRSNWSSSALPVARCAVVGAGLAGASVAHALARRGWQVSVFEQESRPASAASGLPVGLAAPLVSADDGPRSRLTRNGIRLTLQHAQRLLLRGQDWAPCGVHECPPDAPAQWHAQAAWIKPAALVQAWLAQERVQTYCLRPVASLQRTAGLWQVCDGQGAVLGAYEHLVIANAMGSKLLGRSVQAQLSPALQQALQALQPLHGVLSGGLHTEDLAALPSTPRNGWGCFIPQVPGPYGPQWFAGASYERDALRAADLGAQHAQNMQRLAQLLGAEGAALVRALEQGPLSLWSATRCVTQDRLPLVGPADEGGSSGLWFSVGMGSRGLSLAALCAELLAARMGAEPLPLEYSLARKLDTQRVRHARKAAPSKPGY